MLNFGFLGGFGNFISTNCFEVLAKSGDLVGKDDSIPFGIITPEYLSSGTYIYALSFDTVTGVAELRLGVAGDEYEPNTDLFIYENEEGDHIELSWDGTSTYTGTDLAFATTLDGLVGEKACLSGLAIPVILIHYTYSELERV